MPRCRFEEAGPRPGSTRASRGSSNLATLLDSTWQDQQERLAAVSAADPPAPPHGSARATILGSSNLAALLDTNWQGQLEQLVRGRTEALQADITGEVQGRIPRTAGRQHWTAAREDLISCRQTALGECAGAGLQHCTQTALGRCKGSPDEVQACSAETSKGSTDDLQANSTGRLVGRGLGGRRELQGQRCIGAQPMWEGLSFQESLTPEVSA